MSTETIYRLLFFALLLSVVLNNFLGVPRIEQLAFYYKAIDYLTLIAIIAIIIVAYYAEKMKLSMSIMRNLYAITGLALLFTIIIAYKLFAVYDTIILLIAILMILLAFVRI